jgi:hypothetical protein
VQQPQIAARLRSAPLLRVLEHQQTSLPEPPGAADLGEQPRLEIGPVGEPGQLVAFRETPAFGKQCRIPDGFLDVFDQVEKNVLVLTPTNAALRWLTHRHVTSFDVDEAAAAIAKKRAAAELQKKAKRTPKIKPKRIPRSPELDLETTAASVRRRLRNSITLLEREGHG